ncbi:hypothetical protein F5878DRAFT_646572 [Lentinula raphanica]|uniref:Uncharacterized protein n=1 Tax=Lentinula raphanica TaxID=153919 RepID=A0AA38NXX8_9AGAR|nr:hypothetical protein F5878DRAFT_646572 [Lentinula raphanica]
MVHLRSQLFLVVLAATMASVLAVPVPPGSNAGGSDSYGYKGENSHHPVEQADLSYEDASGSDSYGYKGENSHHPVEQADLSYEDARDSSKPQQDDTHGQEVASKSPEPPEGEDESPVSIKPVRKSGPPKTTFP